MTCRRSAPRPSKSHQWRFSIRDDRELWQVIRWMQEIDAILERHEGTQPVEIRLSLGQTDQRLRSRKRRVEWSAELERELQACAAVRAVHCAKVVRDGRTWFSCRVWHSARRDISPSASQVDCRDRPREAQHLRNDTDFGKSVIVFGRDAVLRRSRMISSARVPSQVARWP